MEIVVPMVLLLLGLGAVHLALGGLIRLGKERPEFWLLGLGVRSRFGALKVLVVAVAMLFLAYSFRQQGSLIRILRPELAGAQAEAKTQLARLEIAFQSIQDLKAQADQLRERNQDYQRIVSRRDNELAEQARSLQAALSQQQQETAGFKETLDSLNRILETLQQEKEQAVQDSRQVRQELRSAESKLTLAQRNQENLRTKLSRLTAQNEEESKGLRNEIEKFKAYYRDEKRRTGLLRHGLVSREANDWSLEQEIEKLANLISDQPDASFSRQTDIARTLQRIHELLREGTALAQQAKAAETRLRSSATVSKDSN
jgi:chromosome segregation ATPase